MGWAGVQRPNGAGVRAVFNRLLQRAMSWDPRWRAPAAQAPGPADQARPPTPGLRTGVGAAAPAPCCVQR
eukprot:8428811-Lingulodinium_polyedra.AAC.1